MENTKTPREMTDEIVANLDNVTATERLLIMSYLSLWEKQIRLDQLTKDNMATLKELDKFSYNS